VSSVLWAMPLPVRMLHQCTSTKNWLKTWLLKYQCCAGITLSKEQVRRGTELAREQGIDNVHFQVMCWSFAHAAAGVMLCITVRDSPVDTVLEILR
jgi:hypothetical protein